jgi:hypothetical protein
VVAAMTETRKRSGQARIKTVAVFLVLGSVGAAYGCSSDNASNPNEGLGGAGGGGGQACGTKINDANAYPTCPCAGSHCVPTNLVTSSVVPLLTPCSGGVCVPDNIVEQGENLLLKECTSIGGGKGRCASTCIGAVAGLAAYLPQDVCAANERCAPCFNPANGTTTGICGLGCDKAAPGTPVTFGKCCDNDGLCAPKAALPSALAGALGAESCTNASTDVCVPAKPIVTPGAKFTCCNGGAPSNYSGVCVSACVIDAGQVGSQIPAGNCSSGEKCVPCVNPVDGTKTGVCSDASGQPVDTCTP